MEALEESWRFPNVSRPQGYESSFDCRSLRAIDEDLHASLARERDRYLEAWVWALVGAAAVIAFMAVVAADIFLGEDPLDEKIHFALQFPTPVIIGVLALLPAYKWWIAGRAHKRVTRVKEAAFAQRRQVLHDVMSKRTREQAQVRKRQRQVAAREAESAKKLALYRQEQEALRQRSEQERQDREERIQRLRKEQQEFLAQRDAFWEQHNREIAEFHERERLRREQYAAEELVRKQQEEAEEKRRIEVLEERRRHRAEMLAGPDRMREVMRMTGHEFEQLVAERLRKDGVADAAVSGGAGDRGADVIGDTLTGERVVVQCKRYRRDTRITSAQMQQFAGMVRTQHMADFAIYVTTSSFTKEAERIGRSEGMYLLTYEQLEVWLGTDQPVWEIAIPPA